MASSPGSKSPSRPTFPPPPAPVRPKPKRVVSTYPDIPLKPSLKAKARRISVQDYQQLPPDEINELQSAAKNLFLSDDSSQHLSLVGDFANSSVPRESQVESLWNFCARRFPNSLSLMLAHLLHSPYLPSVTRTHIVDLLHLTLTRFHGQDAPRFNQRVLASLKPLLLDVIENRDELIPELPNLSQVAAKIFVFERWEELLDYVFDALHTEFESEQERALRVLSTLPETRKECLGAYKFWWHNYKSLIPRFLELFDSADLNIRALTFDASVKLVRLLHQWKCDDEFDKLLQIMIRFLRDSHRDAQTHIVEQRMMDLVELAKGCTDHFLKRHNVVLGCLFQIVETVDDNTSIKCQAIEIIRILDERDFSNFSKYHLDLSIDSKRSILENCVRLMCRIADVPACYDLDAEHTGISGDHKLGMFLLLRLVFHSQQDILLPLVREMIPKYLNSEDWQTRHAGVTAFTAIGCVHETIMTEQAETVINISLADPHRHVLVAAIDLIICLVKEFGKDQVKHLTKFVPRLLTIIRSSSIYPSIQLRATTAIHLFIANGADEEAVKSFLKDLMPVLLDLFEKEEREFLKEARETLKSLAKSFPAIFLGYFQKSVDSLKAFTSQSLLELEEKFMDDFSFIFIGPLMHDYLSLLKDIQPEALSQLCELPQQVAGQLLSKIMPDLLPILEYAEPFTKKSKLKKTVLACDLLTKFADHFPTKFEPWASWVYPLLTSLFACSHPEAKIASFRALPSLLRSCKHRKEAHKSFLYAAVRDLFNQLEKGILHKSIGIEMLKSLNASVQICGTQVLRSELVKQIADHIKQILFLSSAFANKKKETREVSSSSSCPVEERHKQELEEQIIQAASCLVTMITTLKSEFLPHVCYLLPAVEALWGSRCPDEVKAVAISILNLLLSDYPQEWERYCDTYPTIVIGLCYSQSPQLQREAARGIGLRATHSKLMPNFDAPGSMDGLNFIIDSGRHSEDRAMAYDAAVSAFRKILEFRRPTIQNPQILPLRLKSLPLRNDFKEAEYGNVTLNLPLERYDRDLLEHNDDNLSKAIQICKKILSKRDNLAIDATIGLIKSWLSKVEAKP
ncbi:hypothetical protein QN277_016040 [Acacia crassicarpa]|uniref:Uncharacterized protein n=1 Tax=Acacia crassicarpa TaxID=499986 RepID=A0AAE1MVS8_9FABA|nr:hypothetical protein QN277_016040 [Acacia crassicarpa]